MYYSASVRICPQSSSARELLLNPIPDDKSFLYFVFEILQVIGVLQPGKFFAEIDEIEAIADDDPEHGFPAEVGQHVYRSPTPGFGHHHHGWGGKVGQRPADRNVDEQETER